MELFRVMRKDADGAPLCGTGNLMLDARVPVDIRPDAAGRVRPGRGGMSVTPGSPRWLPIHLRPETLGGAGRLPVFVIGLAMLGVDLTYRPDEKKPDRHGYVEPSAVLGLAAYQDALFRTAPHWRES